MQERIRGVVLRTVKYKDTGLIVDLFTETHGRMSFMTSVTRGKRQTAAGSALWRPLNFVEFDADIHAQNRLARPHDVRLYCHFADIPFNATKSMQTLFLAEFLSYTLREQQADPSLYRFMETSMQWLDAAPVGHIANFHLYFLIRLTRFVGIEPDTSLGSGLHNILRPEEMRYLPLILRISLSNLHLYRFSRNQRYRILQILENYYRLHLPSFPELRSLDVLREVFAV